MTDLAELGLRFVNQGLDQQNKGLDELAEKAEKAERATESLAKSQQKTKSATGQLKDEIAKVANIQQQLTKSTGDLTISQELVNAALERKRGILGTLRPAIVALVGSMGLMTAAAAGFVAVGAGLLFFWREGQKAAMAYERAVTGVGRTAGLTATELSNLARAGADQGGISIRSANEQAAAYLRIGRVGRDSLEDLLRIGKDYASFMGIDAKAATQDLARAMADPEKAAVEMTRSFGLLTQEQIKAIEKAMELGDQYRAQKILLDALDESVRGHAASVDTVTNAWDAAARAISNAITKFGEWLYVTKDERLGKLNAGIARAEKIGAHPGFVERLTAERDALQAEINADRSRQSTVAAQAQANQAAQIRKDNAPRPGPKARAAAQPPRDTTDERTAQVAAMIARSQGDLLQAQLNLTKEVEARAEIEKRIIDIQLIEQRAQLARQAAAIQDDKGLSQATKDVLTLEIARVGLIQEQVASAQRQKVDQDTAEALAQEALRLTQADNDNASDALRIDLDLARTDKQRLDIQLRLLDLADARERAELDAIIASQQTTEVEREIARRKKAALDATRPAREQGVREANDPAGRAADSIADRIREQDSLVERTASMFARIEQLRRENVLSTEQAERAKAQIQVQYNEERLSHAQAFFGELATLATSNNDTLAAIGKAAAVTQATIDGVLAVQKALASAPPPWNYAMAAAVGVTAAANVASIMAMKDGGMVNGPGGPRDDAALRWLSNGEFVVNAASTARHRPTLEAINAGRAVPREAMQPVNDNAGGRGGLTVIQNFPKGDADSFRRTGRQVANATMRALEAKR